MYHDEREDGMLVVILVLVGIYINTPTKYQSANH